MDKRVNFTKFNFLLCLATIFVFLFVGLSLHGYIKTTNIINYGYLILVGYGLLFCHFILFLFSLFFYIKNKNWKQLLVYIILMILYILGLIGLLFIIALTSGYLGDM
jgi:hypothetical protein